MGGVSTTDNAIFGLVCHGSPLLMSFCRLGRATAVRLGMAISSVPLELRSERVAERG